MGGVSAWVGCFLATSPWRASTPGSAHWADAILVAGASGLVLLTGFAFLRVLERPDYIPDRPAAIRTFSAALLVGVAWAPLVGRHPTAALALGALLAVAAAASAWRFARVDGRAALMLLPWTLACFALLAVQASLVLAPQGG